MCAHFLLKKLQLHFKRYKSIDSSTRKSIIVVVITGSS